MVRKSIFRVTSLLIALISFTTSHSGSPDPDSTWPRRWEYHPGFFANFNYSFEDEPMPFFEQTGAKIGSNDLSRQQRERTHYNRSGVASTIEPETKVLALTIDADYGGMGAWEGGPNVVTSNLGFGKELLCYYGTYSTRIKIPSAEMQPDVGAVVGFYTYYNDEWGDLHSNDWNRSGIFDNSEIDIEWLIADPEVLYIGAYLDFGAKNGVGDPVATQIKRTINLRTGEIYNTAYLHELPLGSAGENLTSVAENSPATIRAIPDFDASKQFYTYGFDWLPTGIRWWILNPADESDTIVLWDYKGPANRFTHKPARFMANFWHTNNWPVITNPSSIEPPAHSFTTEIDWMKYQPYSGDSENIAPTDITLRRSTITESDLFVSRINVHDSPFDTHTITLISGNSNLFIKGDSLMLRNTLSPGVYEVELQAEDQGGLKLRKTLQFTVVEEDGEYFDIIGRVDIFRDWVLHHDNLNTGSGGFLYQTTSIDHTNGTETTAVNLSLTQGSSVGDSPAWATALAYLPKSLKAVTRVAVSYSSNRDFSVNFGTDEYGYIKLLKASSTPKTVIIELPSDLSKNWGERELDLADIRSLGFSTYGEGDYSISLYEVRLYGFNDETSIQIVDGGVVACDISFSQKGELTLKVASDGVYTISLYQLNGRQIYQSSLPLQAGVLNRIRPSAIGGQTLLIAEIAGAGLRHRQKIFR